MVLVGASVGYRISELLSWTLADVLDADGCMRDVVTVESKRLQGGRHIPKAPARPEGHPDLCCCADGKRFRGEIPPKARRATLVKITFTSVRS
jgi:hypothetical protein